MRIDRTLIALIAALAATLVVFALWPELDLKVARLFYGAHGFIGSGPWERAGRDFFRVSPYMLLIVLIAAWGLKALGVPLPLAPSGRAALFLALTMALAPGLIVNVGLKQHAHRPRPVHLIEFGGTSEFKPWYQFDGACAKNCSFASGEAAQGFWMVAPALLVPPAWRAAALGAAFAFGAGASLLRMAFGGHFLSDVAVGGLITLIVIALLFRIIRPHDD
jgi:membrane-associated PAP2 superfamily phosphatase